MWQPGPRSSLRCGAKTRAGGRCRRFAVQGRARCFLHGGFAGRPRGIPLSSEHVAAMVEGRRCWVERMHQLKAAGLIDKLPCGRRRKDLPPLSKDHTIRKAQRIVEHAMAKREKLTAVALAPGSDPPDLPTERPGSEKSRGEKLADNADRSLDFTSGILSLGARVKDQLLNDDADVTKRVHPSQLKILEMAKDTALATISHRLRVEQWAPPEMPSEESAESRKISVVFVGPPRLPTPDAPSLASPAEPLQRRPRLDEILAPLKKLDADRRR